MTSGLEALLEAAKAAARGGDAAEVRRLAGEFRSAFSSTLLSDTARRHPWLLEAYAREAASAVDLLARALAEGLSLAPGEARLAASALTGLLVSDGSCVAVRLRADLRSERLRARRGSVACVELREALHLVLGGLAEPLETGLGDVLGGGEEQHISLGGPAHGEGGLGEGAERGALP